jgi:hypothetical protein
LIALNFYCLFFPLSFPRLRSSGIQHVNHAAAETSELSREVHSHAGDIAAPADETLP